VTHEPPVGCNITYFRVKLALQNAGHPKLAEFSVEEHDADGVVETEFHLPDTFRTQESAIEAAIQAGRQKIDMGVEQGSVVVNG
jgi:hypothetical protein